MLPFKFWVARLEKVSKIWPTSKISKPKFYKHIFRNELQTPFYPILIPTIQIWKNTWFLLGSEKSKNLGILKITLAWVCIKIFLKRKKMGIRNKKLRKVKKFQVWVVWYFFSKGLSKEERVGFKSPPPSVLKVKNIKGVDFRDPMIAIGVPLGPRPFLVSQDNFAGTE